MTVETLKDLLANATPGPWEAHADDQGGTGRDAYVCIDDGSDVVAKAMCYTARSLNRKPYEANAKLISLAPQLAAEVIKLQAEVERLRRSIATAAAILGHEAILAKPSEYDDDEQALLDDFSLRVGLESCLDCVRRARAALEETKEA